MAARGTWGHALTGIVSGCRTLFHTAVLPVYARPRGAVLSVAWFAAWLVLTCRHVPVVVMWVSPVAVPSWRCVKE